MSQKHIINSCDITQSTWQYASFAVLCSFKTVIIIVYVQNMMDLLPMQRSHKTAEEYFAILVLNVKCCPIQCI